MTQPATQDVEDFLAHFGAKGMRWGVLDPSSKAEEVGSAPFLRRTGAPPGQGAVDTTRQGEEAAAAAEESKTADAEAQQALKDLSDIHAEQTQVAAQAHVAAQAAAQAHASAPTLETAVNASQTAATAAAEKAQLAQVTAANKEAAKAEAENKTLQAKLNKLEAKDKAAAAKLKAAKAKAAAKKAHAAKLKAIAKKAKAAHAKHKASKHKPLTEAQKKAKAAYEKAHPQKHKPLTAAQKAKAAEEEREREAKKKAAEKTAKTQLAAKTKLAVEAQTFRHGIDNSAILLPDDKPVKKGGSVSAPSAAQGKMLAKMHLAMPDGSYPIRNGAAGASDLDSAIESVDKGDTAGPSGDGIRKFIIGRAAKLKLSSKIPSAWNSDGSLKHDDIDGEIEDFLEHHGVKGMHWGVDKDRATAAAKKAGSKTISGAKKTGQFAAHNPHAAIFALSAAKLAYDNKDRVPGTIRVIAHIAKLINESRKTPEAQQFIAIGGKFIQGQVIHGDDSDTLAHFGVKGMHWGVRKSHSAEELNAKAKEHEKTSVAHAHVAMDYQKEHADLQNMGTSSTAFKRVYGDHASAMTDREFFRNNGQSKAQALQQTDNNLRLLANYHTNQANSHSKKAVKLRQKASEIAQSDDSNTLEHFGVKGMHWGVRKSSSSEPSSEDHARASAIQAKAKSAGGTHVLSNEELQTLNKRKQLEAEHTRLSGTGESFVKSLIVKQGKQEANKYAAEYAVKGAAAIATVVAAEAARQTFKGKHA